MKRSVVWVVVAVTLVALVLGTARASTRPASPPSSVRDGGDVGPLAARRNPEGGDVGPLAARRNPEGGDVGPLATGRGLGIGSGGAIAGSAVTGVVDPPWHARVPVNVSTRGGTGDYAQVGVISAARVADEGNPRILPLFGRPTYAGSHTWNFYTTTDGYHLLRIPVFYKDRNCATEYGCEEVSDGDYVRVDEYGAAFRVRLYEKEQLRYIPFGKN